MFLWDTILHFTDEKKSQIKKITYLIYIGTAMMTLDSITGFGN